MGVAWIRDGGVIGMRKVGMRWCGVGGGRHHYHLHRHTPLSAFKAGILKWRSLDFFLVETFYIDTCGRSLRTFVK